MSLLRHWKIILVMVSIVLVSAIAGAKFGYEKGKRYMRNRNKPDNWNERVMRGLESDLKLNAEQKQKVQVLLDNAVEELNGVRVQTIAKTTDVVRKLVDDVDNELTPEQKAKFSKMKPKDSDMSLDILKVEPRKK